MSVEECEREYEHVVDGNGDGVGDGNDEDGDDVEVKCTTSPCVPTSMRALTEIKQQGGRG